jgi:hypothetical protein
MVLRCRPNTRAMAAAVYPSWRRVPRVYLSGAVIWGYMGVFILLEEN